MKVVALVACFLLAIVGVSCSENPPTATHTDSPVLGKMGQPPPQSSPFVFRSDDLIGWTIVDWEKDLTVYVGLDIHQFCDWVVGGYQGEILGAESTPFTFRNPGGGDRWMFVGGGKNLTTTVWPTVHDWRDECFSGYYDEVTPVAMGYSKSLAVDNGGAFPDTPNTNSFGVKFNGKLQTPRGDKVNMSAHMQCVWSGPDEDRSPNHINEYPWQSGSCISTVNLSGNR